MSAPVRERGGSMILKTSVDELGVFGGRAAFQQPLHVGQPNLGDRSRLLHRIEGLLDRRWFTNDGPLVREFEQRVCDVLGVRRCVAMGNGTVALQIATKALGLTGEVIVPSFTFVATVHALQWQHLTPVFCDIDPFEHTIDVAQIERLITPTTSAILAVHVWGRVCDVAALAAIADRHDVRVLYDAAHAFGCSHEGKMVGNFGVAEVFSFHATKFVNCFEGGAVVTNDDDLADRMVLMRNFGFEGYDTVTSIGINGKLTEVGAAMGLTSLESWEDFADHNRENSLEYADLVADLDGVSMTVGHPTDLRNHHYVVLEVDSARTGISRDDLLRVLWGENVLARRYFSPGVHRMEPYRSTFPDAGRGLPETERVADRVLVMPTGQTVDAKTIHLVCGLLRFAVENGDEITERFRGAP